MVLFLWSLLCGAPEVSADRADARSQLVDEAAAGDFVLGQLKYVGGRWDPRPRAYPRLAWEVRRRTSVAADLNVIPVDPASEALFDHPLVVWTGDQTFPPLPAQAIQNLRRHLQLGGTVLVDLADGQVGGPFDLAVRRDVRRMFPEAAFDRVDRDHVLLKSFYLVEKLGGRIPARTYVEALSLEGRLALVVYANDLGGAIARDPLGEWEYDVAEGPASREQGIRFGINLVMYALCLDYKEDQVHIPFILKRRH